MTHPWQMVLIWGVMVGGSTGVAALSLSATIVNRWFTTHRGLVMGILTASSATGQLVFLPPLAAGGAASRLASGGVDRRGRGGGRGAAGWRSCCRSVPPT